MQGVRILVDKHFCKFEISQNRYHRRNRINKKWRKKFGFTKKCINEAIYTIPHIGIVMCPCSFSRLKDWELLHGPGTGTPTGLFNNRRTK